MSLSALSEALGLLAIVLLTVALGQTLGGDPHWTFLAATVCILLGGALSLLARRGGS